MANRWNQGYWRDDNYALLTAESPGVRWRGGERLNSDNSLATTVSLTGAVWRQGYLRGPSGERIVADPGTPPLRWHDGELVDANGALVITSSLTGAVVRQGFLRSPSGALVVAPGTP